MNGEEKVIKTWFGKIVVGDVKKIKKELEWQKAEAERLAEEAEYVLNHWDRENIYEIDSFLRYNCSYFYDCTKCPLTRVCKFAKNGCDEVYNCEACPRLRICVRERSEGLKEYLEVEGE